MALELNGTSIPASGALQVNGTSLKEFKANGVLVWTSTPDPITIMKTGSSTGSWLGGGFMAVMPDTEHTLWPAKAIKTPLTATFKPTVAFRMATYGGAARKAQ